MTKILIKAAYRKAPIGFAKYGNLRYITENGYRVIIINVIFLSRNSTARLFRIRYGRSLYYHLLRYLGVKCQISTLTIT